MSTNFPAALDALTNPLSTDGLTGHASQHANENDAIEALQAKVGIDGSVVATSLDYKVTALEASRELAANKNVAGGYAGLDGSGKVAAAQLPSYVDDVVEAATFSALPVTGETGKIYVVIADETHAGATTQYRWAGSAYAVITSSPGSTDAVPEGTINLYFTAQRVRDAVLTGLSLASSAAITAADSVLSALGRLQAQISGIATAVMTLTNKTILSATNTVEATSGPGATQFSHRNKIINGDFRINQRAYVSGAAVGSGLYGLDRWKMAASGDTFTFSTVANKATVTIPAGKALRQVIEGANLQTGTYVLSWEGTAQGKIGAGALAASGVTGAITGGADTTIEFGPGTVANVQLEIGSVATPFEHRMVGGELALCQRYYSLGGIKSQATGATGTHATIVFPRLMRSSPTMTYGNSPQGAGTVLPTGTNWTSASEVSVLSASASINCSWAASSEL